MTSRCTVAFGDVGALVYDLNVILWTLPGFSVRRDCGKLLDLHHRQAAGEPLAFWDGYFSIEAERPHIA